MASAGVIPRSVYQGKPQTARIRNVPIIPHPATKLGDVSDLMITGTASRDMRRPQTVAGYPVNIATCVSWSESDLVSTKKKRYNKKALVTGARTDREVLEMLTERLVDGLSGVRHMFRANDPAGGETVTKEALLQIIYNIIGHISNDCFERILLNLGLQRKDKISFDIFVSRFSDIEDIRKQWTSPVKRAALKENQSKAHPEEALRDCDVNDWARLKVAPHAAHIFLKALKEQRVDLRSLLPGECFVEGGVVSKLQMRYALLDLDINLTDMEYKRFWEKLDRNNAGYLPIQELYFLLEMTPEGEPKKAPSSTCKPHTKLVRSKTDVTPRAAAKAARDFALKRHKAKVTTSLEDAFRVEGICPPSAPLLDNRDTEEVKEGWTTNTSRQMTDSEARSQIRAVMGQKQNNKFDSIMDCLHHKFEEGYVSLTLAFKLFDIHEDGHVMHIDFRRVLTEFGCPVTALQLAQLLRRLGITMKQGLISYKQVLTKLLNRSDPLTSRALDNCLQTKLEGWMTSSVDADSEEEATVTKLVDYMHKDYIRLALFLLRSDRCNRGVLPARELRNAVERCLGYGMSDKQWKELQTKLSCDGEGDARYLDFLLSFSGGDPGSWNLLTVGPVTVPRNKVVYAPTKEVHRLERAKSEMLPTAPTRKDEHRPLDQLHKELEEFFAHHLCEVDQRFKELDRKSHTGFSQWQFGALLNLCGFPMTEKELATFWISLKLDGDLSTFEDIIGHFTPDYEHKNKFTDKEEMEPTVSKFTHTGPRTTKTTRTRHVQQKRAHTAHVRSASTPSLFQTQVMLKAKPSVVKNWEYLRQRFRNLDPNGLGSVTFQQMQRLVESLRAGLSHEERSQLCQQFDFRNNGRCNYLSFMKAFSDQTSPQSKLVYNSHIHTLEKQPRDTSEPLTVNDALIQIRTKLIKQFKTLRRGFTHNDRSKSGYLSVSDFRRVLSECGVSVTEEDVYHLLSEFDSNMDGRVSYSEFLDALLRVG